MQVIELWISLFLVHDPIAPHLSVSQLHSFPQENTEMTIDVCLAQYFVGFGSSVSWIADEGKGGRQNVWDLPCEAVMLWS